MPYSAATFLARQREEANDTGTPVYADSVYNELRDDALAAISRAAPADSSSSVSVTSGSTAVPLPADFVTIVTSILDPDAYPHYRLITPAGDILVPDDGSAFRQVGYFPASLAANYFTLFGQNIVLPTVPTATESWTLRYGGLHTLATIPTDWVGMALDYASARVFDRKAAATASFFRYSLSSGSVDIDKSGESQRWAKLRDQRMASFEQKLAKVATHGGAVGSFTFHRG